MTIHHARRAEPCEWPVLHTDSVHVWHVDLDAAVSHLRSLWEVLDDQERLRATRLVRVRDRNRFVAGRAALRLILAHYLKCDPAELDFVFGRFGKPRLSDLLRTTLSFNLAHSGGMALYAVAKQREVGIDLEQIRPGLETEEVVQAFLTGREQAELYRLPQAQQSAAFFRCWTRKEALVKARGEGVAGGLGQIDVSLEPHSANALRTVYDEPEAHLRWSLQSLQVPEGYTAALAAERHDWSTQAWNWRW
jgi:4'-phosphopantetheinyl transferase